MSSTFCQKGFSLLEMIVALVILSLSLGMLYQATAGATRNVRVDERYSYAMLLAQSLLAEYPEVAPGGIGENGEVEDYRWQVASELLPDEDDNVPMPLHRLVAEVAWDDGASTRDVRLVTVVPEALSNALLDDAQQD